MSDRVWCIRNTQEDRTWCGKEIPLLKPSWLSVAHAVAARRSGHSADICEACATTVREQAEYLYRQPQEDEDG